MILRRAAPACLALTAALAATVRAQTPPIPRLESRGFNLHGMDCRRRGKNPRSMNAKRGRGNRRALLVDRGVAAAQRVVRYRTIGTVSTLRLS
jgi:hypothetical protein